MRTEGDTWDIVSSVGATALGVAATRAVETVQPDALVRDEYAALFVAASGHEGMNRIIADPSALRDSPMGPAMIGLRSKFFDDHFLDAAADDVRQAVILAAGLDARAYRLPWPPGTVVFELDQPKVLEFKRQVLTEHGAVAPADRREVAVDLRDDWPQALLEAGFDPSAPTAWSAEGLLPYLPGVAQDALFERIARLSAPGSRLATDTISNYEELGRMAEYQADHMQDTPFAEIDLSGLFYTDDRTEPDAWFAAHGWSTTAQSPTELASRYERALPPVPEQFEAMFRSSRYVTVTNPVTAPSA
ncbi:class I SAM-dependent methyltransferase [Nocardia transvalensis]|uniref:class I SAM-dependent methyltransferase n=1 Tax=Nocardia transvalensis TaxID=37333 RepID=UPI0018938918|nr:class I SAM-dependent methyltransferase [Nocardia transvalensis]MBF6329764.1 class I SAM-dependent methyltransferase [Nocardia transvalensis]